MGLSRSNIALLAVAASALGLASCGTYLLPADGPNALVIRSQQTWNGPPYGLVKLTPKVIQTVEEFGPRSLTGIFGDLRPPPEISWHRRPSASPSSKPPGGLFIPSEAGARPVLCDAAQPTAGTKGFISVLRGSRSAERQNAF